MTAEDASGVIHRTERATEESRARGVKWVRGFVARAPPGVYVYYTRLRYYYHIQSRDEKTSERRGRFRRRETRPASGTTRTSFAFACVHLYCYNSETSLERVRVASFEPRARAGTPLSSRRRHCRRQSSERLRPLVRLSSSPRAPSIPSPVCDIVHACAPRLPSAASAARTPSTPCAPSPCGAWCG